MIAVLLQGIPRAGMVEIYSISPQNTNALDIKNNPITHFCVRGTNKWKQRIYREH